MRLSHYIKELIYEHEYVIVPGLGAFVSNYKPATIKEEDGVLHPPSKEITFSSKLKNNDGLLIKYISEVEGITDLSASRKIEKEKDSILYQLNNGEKIDVEGIGFLYLNEDKQICFEPDIKDNLLVESFGLEPAGKKEEGVGDENKIVINETQDIGKKKWSVWIWILLVPLISAGIFIYLNYKYPPQNDIPVEKSGEIKKDTILAKEEIVPSDTMVTENAEKDTVSSDTTQSVEQKTDTGQVYYLVGGSFGVKANADKYFNRVKALGYEPVHLGKQGNLYVVAVEKYFSLDAAENAQREFLAREPKSGVWIMPIDQ